MKNIRRKLLSIVITTAMLVAMLPASAFAANSTLFTSYLGNAPYSDTNPMGFIGGLRSTAMDKDGNIWFATKGGGLIERKADGSFQEWNEATEPALAMATIYAAAPDAEGGVYIAQGYYSGAKGEGIDTGMLYMKDGKVTLFTEKDRPSTVPGNFVQEIKVDDNGIVWIGSEYGLTKYEPKSNKWTTWSMRGAHDATEAELLKDWFSDHPEWANTWREASSFPAQSVDNMEIDSKGGIWLGFYPEESPSDPTYLKYPVHGGISYFKDGKIQNYYLASRYETQSKTSDGSRQGSYRLADCWIRDIALDANDGAWVIASGTRKNNNIENHGGWLMYFSEPGAEPVKIEADELFGKYLDNGYPENNINASEIRMLNFDKNGGLWIGTTCKGMLYIKNPSVKNGKFNLKVTAQFNHDTGAWSGPMSKASTKDPSYDLLDNVACLDFYGDTLYAGGYNQGMVCATLNLNNIKSTVALKSVKAQKDKVKLTWGNATGSNIDSYLIYRSTKKNSDFKKIATVKKGKTTYSASTKKLKKGKTYYYKIRVKKVQNKKTTYSYYSAVKSAKVK